MIIHVRKNTTYSHTKSKDLEVSKKKVAKICVCIFSP